MSVEKVALRLVVTGDTSGARAALKGIGTESGKLGKALKTAQIGAAAGLVGIAGLAEAGRLSYEKLTASVASLQRQSKISAPDASILVGQWQRYGVSIEQGTRATTLFSKAMYAVQTGAKGSESATQAFNDLGVSMEDLKTKSPAEMLEIVREKLSTMPPSAKRTWDASTLMGKGFMSMQKWIAASKDDLGKLNQTLTDTGQVMSDAELAKAKDDLKAQADMAVQWRGILLDIGRTAMPMMRTFTDVLSGAMRVLAPLAPKLQYVAAGLAAFLVVTKISAGIKAINDGLTTMRSLASVAGRVLSRSLGGTAAGPTSGSMGSALRPSTGTAGETAASTGVTRLGSSSQISAGEVSTLGKAAAGTSGKTGALGSKAGGAGSSVATMGGKAKTAAAPVGTLGSRAKTAAPMVQSLGTRAKTASPQVGTLGTFAGRTKTSMGKLSGAMDGPAGSIAMSLAFSAALAFTIPKVLEAGSAFMGWMKDSGNLDQARAGRQDAQKDYQSKLITKYGSVQGYLDYIAKKYGKNSSRYELALESVQGLGQRVPGTANFGRMAGSIPQAAGGDYMVNRPTLFLAGEAGPERATFTPQGKAAPGVLTVNVNIANVNGTDGQTANAFANKVADIVARRQYMAAATGY